MHYIYLRPFFLSKCKAHLIEHGFDRVLINTCQHGGFLPRQKSGIGGRIAHFFRAFFITLFLYHGHFISLQNANGSREYEIIMVEAIPMRVLRPMERMAGWTAKRSEATTMTRMMAEKKMATLCQVSTSRSPVRACLSKPSVMKML